MNRRQYLARSTVPIGVLSSLAGCLDGLDEAAGGYLGDDRERDEGNEDDRASTAEREVDREIRRAVGKLNKAGLSVAAVGDRLEERDAVEFDPDEPRERVDAARDHLDAAEANATGERRTDVAELRAYADVVDGLVDVTEAILDRDAAADLEGVAAAIDDGRFDDARATVREQRAATDATRERLDPAIETLADLDRDRLDSLDAADVDRVEAGATTLANVLDALDALTLGFASIVDGYEHLARGREHVDDREFDRATAAFEAARGSYRDATATLEGGRENAPEGLRPRLETTLCRTGHLVVASARFEESAAAAADGDATTADEKRDEGEAAIEAAENCDG